jgi:oligoendopeptidase F
MTTINSSEEYSNTEIEDKNALTVFNGQMLSPSKLLESLESYCADLAAFEYSHQQALFTGTTLQPDASKVEVVESMGVELEERYNSFLQRIASITEEDLHRLIEKEPGLVSYTRFIAHIRHKFPQSLDDRSRQLTTRIKSLPNSAKRLFDALVNQDFNFGEIDIQGNHTALKKNNYSRMMVQNNREIRNKAYNLYYKQFETHKHSLSIIFKTHIAQEIMYSRIQGSSSTRKRIFDEDNVAESVHDTVIGTIRRHASSFHRYFSLRKAILGVERLEAYDLMVPLVKIEDFYFPYRQAVTEICGSVALLGDTFTTTLKEGLLKTWVDYAEREDKRPGAFTSTSYYGGPFVNLNYKEDVVQSLFTLAHESGHAMHAWYSIQHNPFHTYAYDVLVTETVAAVHEELLYRHLILQAHDVQTKAFLLERQLQGMTLKLLRQTLLAEFEHKVFLSEESGTPMSLQDMRNLFRSLWKHYYGPSVHLTPVGDLEWLTVDQMYTPYYSYTYPTGAIASLSIADSILNGKKDATSHYMRLLKSGGTFPPEQTFSLVGIDLTSDGLYNQAMEHFDTLLHTFEEMVDSLGLL